MSRALNRHRKLSLMQRTNARFAMRNDLRMRIEKLLERFYVLIVDGQYVVVTKVAVLHTS